LSEQFLASFKAQFVRREFLNLLPLLPGGRVYGIDTIDEIVEGRVREAFLVI
jgi:hypothetical protein